MRVLNTSPVYMFGVLLAIFATFTVINASAFTSTGNLQNIAENAAPYLVMAVAMTFLMIAGGLDLSIGSVLVFANVIEAKVMGADRRERNLPRARRPGGRHRRRHGLGTIQRLLHHQAAGASTDHDPRHPRGGARRGRPDHRRQRHPHRATVADQLGAPTRSWASSYIVWVAIVVAVVFGLILHTDPVRPPHLHRRLEHRGGSSGRHQRRPTPAQALRSVRRIGGTGGLPRAGPVRVDDDLRPQHRRDHGDHGGGAWRDEPLRRLRMDGRHCDRDSDPD